MPKRTLQKPAEKKLKPNLSSTKMSKNREDSDNINLNEATLSKDNVEENNEKPKTKVEYLTTPVKSENDKKEYR